MSDRFIFIQYIYKLGDISLPCLMSSGLLFLFSLWIIWVFTCRYFILLFYICSVYTCKIIQWSLVYSFGFISYPEQKAYEHFPHWVQPHANLRCIRSWVQSLVGSNKNFKTGFCCNSAEHAALRSSSIEILKHFSIWIAWLSSTSSGGTICVRALGQPTIV